MPEPFDHPKCALDLQNNPFPSPITFGRLRVPYGRFSLITAYSSLFFASVDDITAAQVIVLGKMPRELWEKWEAKHEYFSETGEYITPNCKLSSVSWEDRFEKHIQSTWREHGVAAFGEEEKAAFLDMIRSMLSFRPEEWATIQGVLNSEWMKKWALPSFEKYRSGTV